MKKKTVDKQQNILVGTLSINQILDQIDFEDEEVEHAARTLPKLFLETARYRVRVLRNRQSMEQEYDMARVDTAILARAHAVESGTKVTEAAINSISPCSNSRVNAGRIVLLLHALPIAQHAHTVPRGL